MTKPGFISLLLNGHNKKTRAHPAVADVINTAWSSQSFCWNVNHNHWSASFHSCHRLWPLIQNDSSLIFRAAMIDSKVRIRKPGMLCEFKLFSSLTKDSCSCVSLCLDTWILQRFVFMRQMQWIVLSCHNVTYLYALHTQITWHKEKHHEEPLRRARRHERRCETDKDERPSEKRDDERDTGWNVVCFQSPSGINTHDWVSREPANPGK